MADDALFTIAGQEFKVTSPERVLYPATGTTKLDVIGYYVLRTNAGPAQASGGLIQAQLSGQALSRARAVPLLPSW